MARWKWINLAVCVFPVVLVTLLGKQFFILPPGFDLSGSSLIPLGQSGYLFFLWLLSSVVLILINLEQTLRASVGTKRWQIKFMVLGFGSLFAVQVYTSSETLLFAALNIKLDRVYCGALIVADVLILFSLTRARFLELDIYLSPGLSTVQLRL